MSRPSLAGRAPNELSSRGTAAAIVLLAVLVIGGGAWTDVDVDPGADGRPLSVSPIGDCAGIDYRVTVGRAVSLGGGAYVSDYDGDRLRDLLVIGGLPAGVEKRTASTLPVLYENVGGRFRASGALPREPFTDRRTVGAHFFDADNDGLDELLLLSKDGDPIYLANTGGTFRRAAAGFDANLTEPVGAASGDYDGDGDLDVVVFQSGDWQTGTPAGYNRPDADLASDNGNPNVLFENTEDGFERVDVGVARNERWTLAASFVDLTGDGRPDLYAANDYNADVLYVNRPGGTFEAVELGERTDRNGMSAEIADVNRDGRPDVFVTNIYFDEENLSSRAVENYLEHRLGKRTEGNNLLLNRGDGRFEDAARTYGVARGGWGWAAVLADLDNDGDRDLFHATKQFDSRFETGSDDSYVWYPALYERTGPERFERRNASRHGFERSDGLGVAALDHDADGDVDLVVGKYLNGRFDVYRNDATGSALRVEVEGTESQTPIGARVFVTVDGRTRTAVVNSKADFLSQDARVLHFGLGDSDRVDRVRVVWPDGTERSLTDVRADQLLVVGPDEVDRGAAPDVKGAC